MPVMLCEPVHQTKEQREQLAQILFEKFDVPALFLAKNSVLASYGCMQVRHLRHAIDMPRVNPRHWWSTLVLA
jgi:hypothetical protein